MTIRPAALAALLLVFSHGAFAQEELSLTAPATAPAGSELVVRWTGDAAEKDFVTIVAKDTPEGRYNAYEYLRKNSSATLTVPESPGDYEVRILGAQSPYPTVASSPLTVTDVSATLSGPESAPGGSEIEIVWTGPSNRRDFITLVPADAADNTYKKYEYTAKGSPVKLTMPDEPGNYEVRYLLAKTKRVLARHSVVATATTATVDAPDSVDAGAYFEVAWTGPDNRKDFITLVPAGAADKAYEKYQYTRRGNPVKLRAPDEPGDYEVRYLTGQTLTTLASQPLSVGGTEATLSAPDSVAAGAYIEVAWTGPDNRQDFVTIVPAGAEDKSYDTYQYTARGATLKIRAPDVPGEYELRYLTGQNSITLASRPIRITATDASLAAVDTAMAGSAVEVAWTGPDNRQDYIAIVGKDRKDGEYDFYTYTAKGSPLTVTVPETEGDYELRYMTGQDNVVLARRALTVTPISASLDSPPTVEARTSLDVTWEGPGNARDYVIVVPAGADKGVNGPYAYTRRGQTLTIDAPLEPGEYEVRYVTGQQKRVLASNPLTVTPTEVPGRLLVVGAGGAGDAGGTAGGPAVAVVLDASGSMLQRMDGRRRIEIARDAVTEFVSEVLEDGTPFVLRVFGHKEADACRTDLEIPLAPLNKAQVAAKVGGVNAMNLAKTPIAASLEAVASDLGSASGPHLIVLVTDGEETCDGDPAAAIEKLRGQGFDVRVNIVGFAIDERMLKDTFIEWARLGGGRYFDARNADELSDSMRATTRVPYEVLDADGNLVASGVVGGKAIELKPGAYSIRPLDPTRSDVYDATVVADEETRVSLTN